MIEKLIVVGNGYDLARHYKTSYTDFFNWLDSKFNVDFTEPLHIVDSGKNFDLLQFIYNNEEINKLNFWYIYMTLLKPINKDWNNIESLLKVTLTNIPKKMDEFYNSVSNDSDTALANFLGLKSSAYNKIFLAVILACQNSKDELLDTYDFLFKALLEFEQLFREYLHFALNQPKDLFYSAVVSAIDSTLIGDTPEPNVSILNFNYTRYSEFDKNQMRNIHGAILNSEKDPLIFGIDSTGISSSDKAYRFTKTARIMSSGINQNYASVLSHDIKDICFMGHSLNEADYGYFQSIFDYLSIYDSPVNLNFYYTYFHESNPEIMSGYQHAIQMLLDRYGDTLDNKSHGDNLTAKLLLENRLRLIKIDF